MSNHNSTSAPRQGLQGRWDEAVRQPTAGSKNARFWVVYSFKVREGVGVDEQLPAALRGKVALRGLHISLRPAAASSNVGVFVLHGGEGIERVEIHDLDRYRAGGKEPVRSLGRADNSESLSLLNSLYEKNAGGEVGERLVLAAAMHDDPQVVSFLKRVINSPAASEKEKGTAAMWLGQTPEQKGFLEGLARDGGAPVEVRKQAVVGLGYSHYPDVLSTLQSLYETVAEKEVKEQALFASSNLANRAGATAFLKRVKDTDVDPDLRRQAALWLERLSGPGSF